MQLSAGRLRISAPSWCQARNEVFNAFDKHAVGSFKRLMDRHGLEFLAVVAGIAFYALPLFYFWLLIRGLMGKSRVPTPAAAICLALWLIQLPILAAVALGCVGGGCAGKWGWDLVLFVAFDVVPFTWLVWKFRP